MIEEDGYCVIIERWVHSGWEPWGEIIACTLEDARALRNCIQIYASGYQRVYILDEPKPVMKLGPNAKVIPFERRRE